MYLFGFQHEGVLVAGQSIEAHFVVVKEEVLPYSSCFITVLMFFKKQGVPVGTTVFTYHKTLDFGWMA